MRLQETARDAAGRHELAPRIRHELAPRPLRPIRQQRSARAGQHGRSVGVAEGRVECKAGEGTELRGRSR